MRNGPASLLLSVVLAAMPVHALSRDLSGEAAYRERIALTPDALLVVEVTAPDGSARIERVEAEGRQVPLPFTIDAPAGEELRLRAAIFSAGRPMFASESIVIPGGDGPVDVGTLMLTRFHAMGFATPMRCGDRAVEVGFLDNIARLKVNGQVFDLQPVPSASGARFESPGDPGTWVFTKGNSALVSLRGTALPECLPAVAAGLFPMRAQGNEPGWTLTIADGSARFEGDYGATVVEGALPSPEVLPGLLRFTLASGLVIEISDSLHRDNMTGMPFPLTVSVIRDGIKLTGGGGEPASLLHGDWTIEEVAGAAVVEGAEVTIAFTPEGSIAGKGACNRYMGGFTLTGEGMSFSPLGSTMMACEDHLMRQERALFDALATVSGFDIADDGGLLLTGAGTVAVRARR